MDITNYKLDNPKDIERLSKDAADGCYAVSTSQMQRAMATVIEVLCLPSDVDAFTSEEMATYIMQRILVKKAARKHFG